MFDNNHVHISVNTAITIPALAIDLCLLAYLAPWLIGAAALGALAGPRDRQIALPRRREREEWRR